MYCKFCGLEHLNDEKSCLKCGETFEIDREFVKPKRPCGITASIVLGSVSLFFSILTIYAVLIVFYGLNINEDKFTILSIIFSVFLFGFAGLICGCIGFIKARIVRKGGYYVTTGSVLSFFGMIICSINIILAIVSFLML